MTKGEQFRSFLSIDTLINSILKLYNTPNWTDYSINSAINLSEQHYYCIAEVANLIANKLNLQNKLIVGALEYRSDEVWHQKPCLKLATKLLGEGYTTNFENMISKIIESMRCEYEDRKNV